ncbi:hypothetical protein D3C75_891380 [compost metagenome]
MFSRPDRHPQMGRQIQVLIDLQNFIPEAVNTAVRVFIDQLGHPGEFLCCINFKSSIYRVIPCRIGRTSPGLPIRLGQQPAGNRSDCQDCQHNSQPDE